MTCNMMGSLGSGGIPILVTDDDPDTADSCVALLRSQGYDARAAYSAVEALNLVKRLKPRLALLDIDMPGMNGLELARRIRSWAPAADMALIAVTGWSQSDARQFSIAAGFNEYCPKPVQFDRLMALVQRCLAAERPMPDPR